MDIRFTKRAELDLYCFDADTKEWLKGCIEKLPHGDIRKLADFSSAFRLRVTDYCIVYEEKPNRNAGRQVLSLNRDIMLELNAITFLIMRIIPRPITWMEEIEAVRVGREEAKKGEIKSLEEVAWT